MMATFRKVILAVILLLLPTGFCYNTLKEDLEQQNDDQHFTSMSANPFDDIDDWKSSFFTRNLQSSDPSEAADASDCESNSLGHIILRLGVLMVTFLILSIFYSIYLIPHVIEKEVLTMANVESPSIDNLDKPFHFTGRVIAYGSIIGMYDWSVPSLSPLPVEGGLIFKRTSFKHGLRYWYATESIFGRDVPSLVFISPSARVGEFVLTEEIIKDNLKAFKWMPLPDAYLPDEAQVHEILGLYTLRKQGNGTFTTVRQGSRPKYGDVKIKYEYVADGFDVSIIGRQVWANTETGRFSFDKIDNLGISWIANFRYMLLLGTHDKREMMRRATIDRLWTYCRIQFFSLLLMTGIWTGMFNIQLCSMNPVISNLGTKGASITAFTFLSACHCTILALVMINYFLLAGYVVLMLSGFIAGIFFWMLLI